MPTHTPSNSAIQRWSLGEGEVLLRILALNPRPTTGGRGMHWWLLKNGRAVAYARSTVWPQEAEPHTLLDIEVRCGERRKGHARRLTELMSEHEGLQLHSTGNWTSDGARALHFLPLASGYEPGVYHSPKNFVASWEKLRPRYP